MNHKRNIKETPRNLAQTSRRSAKYRGKHGASRYFASFRTRKLVDENVDAIDANALAGHDELCPLMWNEESLDPTVRKALLKITKRFIAFLGTKVKVKDVVIVGSMANYNWSDTSDVDIHVMVDHNDIDADEEIVSEFFAAKKTIWNTQYSIKLKGHDVEMYVQNVASPIVSQGIFSIAKDAWVHRPKRGRVRPDVEPAKLKASAIIDLIDNLETIVDDDKKIRQIEKLKDKIKQMRASGLAKEAGEYSTENLAFKILRNSGYMNKLMKINTKAFNSYFSLNEAASPKYEFGCLMAFFKIPVWDKLLSVIDKEDLYEGDGGYGLEHEPHVTVLFGFHDELVNPKQLKKDVETIIGDEPLSFRLGLASIFDNPLYDVLKFDVDDSDGLLNKLHEAISLKYENSDKYPDYHPHATIAYVKKGEGQRYADMINEAQLQCEVIPNRMVYSKPPKPIKFFWKLDAPISLEMDEKIDGMTPEKLDVIKDFISFVKQKLKIEEPLSVSLRAGRDEYIRTTAAYGPAENKNYVRCNGRSLIDILRSIAHELVHNRQRELGKFKVGEAVQNIGGRLEGEADAIAGRLIKDFTHNHGYDHAYDL